MSPAMTDALVLLSNGYRLHVRQTGAKRVHLFGRGTSREIKPATFHALRRRELISCVGQELADELYEITPRGLEELTASVQKRRPASSASWRAPEPSGPWVVVQVFGTKAEAEAAAENGGTVVSG